MPAITIDNASKTQFLDTIHQKAQQIRSRMKPYVNLMKISGKQAAYDGLGQVQATELTGRFNKVVFSDIEHTRRKISRRRFNLAIPIDKIDINDIMRDPESEYSTAIVRAIERVYDRVSIEAALASVYTGEDFSTTVTAATDGVSSIDATGGLTYDHLNEMRAAFINNDVGTDMPETFFLCITGHEHRALLADYRVVTYDANGMTYNQIADGTYTAAASTETIQPSPLASKDFTMREGRIENGVLKNVCGFNIVAFAANAPVPILEVDADNDYRSCIAASTRGLVVGIHDDLEVEVEDRSDYVQVKQIKATIVLGAVRTEGVLVQELQTIYST